MQCDSEFSIEELEFINKAAQFFEEPGLFARSLNWVGPPIEYAQNRLPKKVKSAIMSATKIAIEKALIFSIQTIRSPTQGQTIAQLSEQSKTSGRIHTTSASLVGGIGGFFGLAALPLELPVSTVIILRSIADVAQNYGFDLSCAESRLECIYVLTLGTKSENDHSMDSAYYVSRIAFSEMIKNASAFIVGSSAKDLLSAIEHKTAPVLVSLIASVADQFGIRVTKKLLAQSAPIVGALGGASINGLFAKFFRDCAHYHFGLKRLEIDRGFERTRDQFELARRNYKRQNET